MSRIQEDAKPHLIAIGSGVWPNLDAAAVVAVCKWVKMATISIEYADTSTKAISQEDRFNFYETNDIGDNWIILFGLCSEAAKTGVFWHRAGSLIDASAKVTPHSLNVQTTTVHIGSAFYHAISAPSAYLPSAADYAASLGIRQFWPLTKEQPVAPLIFTEDGFERVCVKYWTDLGAPAEPHFGFFTPAMPRSDRI